MAKVKVKYKVILSEGYNRTKYRTKTIKIDLPTDDYGFMQMMKLADNTKEYFKTFISDPFEILSLQILS